MLDIVSSGSAPTVVHDSLIENLQSWAGNEVDIFTLQPTFRVGNQVEVTSGPLQGFSGTILKEVEERTRVIILLSFLHSRAQVSVERTDLRLIA